MHQFDLFFKQKKKKSLLKIASRTTHELILVYVKIEVQNYEILHYFILYVMIITYK